MMRAPSYSSLDDALESLAGYGIALKNGNSNHAPMVAEALCALGRPDAVTPWIARYRERMLPRPPAVDPIRSEDWRSSLGQRDRFTDWAEFVNRELQVSTWREVLDFLGSAARARLLRRRDAWRHPRRSRGPQPCSRRDAVSDR
jgi:hypothetical protein